MLKHRIFILGASGMAGHMIYYYLKKQNKYVLYHHVHKKVIEKNSIIFDIRNEPKFEKIFYKINPDIVINCIGSLIRESKENPSNTIYKNSYFPHKLKSLCDKIESKLIHISTDCVFSGKKGNYSENDYRDADDLYGRSKILGEIINHRDLTLRTSIIGPELKNNGEGLFHWFFNQKGTINGFSRVFWSGITTLELAKVIDYSIKNKISGLLHITNGNKISKYDLMVLFKEIWEKDDIIIKKFNNSKSDKSLLPSANFRLKISSYKNMLYDLKVWMITNKRLYSRYIN